MRFLHLADLHLDTSFACRGPVVAARMRRALRDTLARAVDVALSRRVDAVLVAGDLFDGGLLTFDTRAFLSHQVERLSLANIPFLYAPGNHDPADSLDSYKWPANVEVFASPEPATIPILDPAGKIIATVTGAGHDSPRVSANLASRFPAWQPSAIPRIALLHTLVEGAHESESHDRYAPCGRTDLRSKGYDYWALGHVHERQLAGEDPLAVYPGNPQGRSPREQGPRGAYEVTLVAGQKPQLTFHPLAAVRWETVRITELDQVRELDELLSALHDKVREALKRRVEAKPDDAIMLRVLLEGACPLHRQLREPDNRSYLERELLLELRTLSSATASDPDRALEIVDLEIGARVRRPIDLTRARARADVLGEALRLVDAVIAGSATLPGIEAGDLAGRPDGMDVSEYLRSLLVDADQLLAEHLLVADS